MNESTPQLARNLGHAGLLPFLAGAFIVWVLPPSKGLLVTSYFAQYSAVILSFLGGMLWSTTLMKNINPGMSRALLWLAILFSLAAWLSTFLAPLYALLVLCAGFWVARVVEQRSVDRVYPLWLITLRNWLTRIVIACHISVLVFIAQY